MPAIRKARVVMSAHAVIPAPVSYRSAEGAFRLSSDTSVAAPAEWARVVRRLRAELGAATGFAFPVGEAGIHFVKIDGLAPEAYRLIVSPEAVHIEATDEAGAFYGLQTLRQLLPVEIFRSAPVNGVEWSVPACRVEDAPRFRWRGMHLDVCRHFMPKEFVLKMIDLIALHKMNSLHWHLTEDQGWRIEIKRYPKLTEVGAWRDDTMLTLDPPTYTGKPHGGFYTQDDVREVVAYATERFVNVVPEVEMPGHAQAPIAAYPELGNTGEDLKVWTRWGVSDNVYNVEDSTFEFLENVLSEVLELFPSEFIHVGGDECPKTQWKASERAQARMKAEGLKDEDELQSWFIRRMDRWLADRGRRLVGWDEILEGGLAPGATVMSWRGEQGGIDAAKAGHDVIMTPGKPTYFDHYQAEDRSSEPHAIGGFNPLSAVYAYDPVPAELNDEEAKRVLGSQGQLWTEYMPNPKHVEFMAFPRACALSEVVWSPSESKSYEQFLDRLRVHLDRLKALDVNFRRPEELA